MPPRRTWPNASLVSYAVSSAAVLGRGALGDDDDRERRAARVAALEVVDDLVDVERALRDEDHVGAAGHAGVDGEPAGVTAHDLAHEDAVVRLRGRVQAVDRVRGDLHRGLEAEREVRRRQVVVDRLRHADDGDAVLVQLAGDAEGVLAADRDQRVEALGLHRRLDLVQAVLDLVHVGAGRPEDRPAAVQDARACCRGRGRRLVVDDAGPAVRKPKNSCPWASMPLRTMARMTAFSPGQSPPPVSTPILMAAQVMREPAPGAVSCSHFGNQRSRRGRYQLRSPSSFMAAGSSTARTSVASSRMATARPTPICLNSIMRERREDREHRDHHDRGARHDAGRGLDAVRDRVVGGLAAVERLADAADDEHVVVHREPEQDHEHEQRQPGRDAADGLEVQQALEVAVLEDPRDHAVGGADGQQVEHDRLQRDDDAAERDEQQQEREAEHEREHERQARVHAVVEVLRAGGHAGHVGLGAGDAVDRLRDRRVAQGRERGVGAFVGAVARQRDADDRDFLVRARRSCRSGRRRSR